MPSSDYSALRVLIVDDFNNFRSALAKNMYNLGFRKIQSVANGSEAMGCCYKEHYDLILSDYNLGPGKNGQQLLEELRVCNLFKYSDIFILISADTSRNVVMASYDCEPSDYLTKPITGKTLEQRIHRLMKKREVLLPILYAIDDKNYEKSISLLEACLEESSRYSADCQKLLGELYLQEGMYEKAEELYLGVLALRELDWAKVGLASISLKQGHVKEAIDSLDQIVIDHPAYLKAYDCLSEACIAEGDSEKLQEVLEKAVDISPMSIGRQKNLADTALANGDVELAMKAYKKTIKYGANSYYDSAENHLNLARAITKVYDNDISAAKSECLDAVHLLNSIDDKYEISEEQKIQAKLLNSQINALHGNKSASKNLFTEAQKLIEDSDHRCVDTEVEEVNVLVANGEVMLAQSKLKEMLEFYASDESALEKIDPLLEEPVSEKGKKMIGSVNKKGIQYYRKENFEEAINYFSKAQKKFPRYVGIKLNLVQAMISDIRVNGLNEEYGDKCESIFKVVERYITPSNDKFQRYKQLKMLYRQAIQQAEFNDHKLDKQEKAG